jgi:fumarate hydratase class II
MKVRLFAIAALAVAFSASASAECVYPKTPDSSPNGSTATEAEMVAGMSAFKKYDAEVNAYLGCLDTETNTRIAAAGDKADEVKQIKIMSTKKHNAAIDELQARADEFNSQLRAYKAKHKG